MNKHLLALTFLTLFGTHTLEARHHKTQIAEAAPTQVVTASSTQVVEVAQTAAAVQALQEIVKSPEDVRQLVTQLEQHKEVKSWLARNKKFLISAGISAGVVATLILWWWFKRQSHGNLLAAPVQQDLVTDPLLNNPSQVTPVNASGSTPEAGPSADPLKGLLGNYVENKRLFPDDNEKRPHTFSQLRH